MPNHTSGALQGVRVLEFCQMLAGPFAGQMLADQGADVIKIEPLAGDETRRVGPFHRDDTLRAFGGYFASVNRNKRSIALDLKQPEGLALALKLIDGADVLMENFRSGVMDRIGLGYETLRARNPKLVYGTIRGFGDPRTGPSPMQDWPAYDIVAQAMGGLMQINGPDADAPMKVGPGIGDLYPAVQSSFGILAALLRAQRTGEGQFVDVSMVDAILSLCERTVHQQSFQGVVPHAEGNRHPLLTPYGAFRARDGWVTIAAHFDTAWQALCACIARPDMIDDPRTATAAARHSNRDHVHQQIETFTSRHSKQELSVLLGGRIPFGPVCDVNDVIASPHFAAREMVVEVSHPGLPDPVRIAGVPVKLTGTPGGVHSRAPMLGEHTAEVLGEIGLTPADVDRLREQRVVA